MKKWMVVVVAVILIAGAGAPVDVQPAAPQRIISLVPAVTEMLFAIGAGDQVIGVSSYDRYPDAVKTRERVGALIDPDIERILSLRPDLVVVYGTQAELIPRLARASVPMFHYEHAGLADITQTIRRLGETIGRAPEATTLADTMEREIAAIRLDVARRPRPRTALIIGREPGGLRGMYASAGIGFLHDMLEAAGGTDVFADVGRQSVQVSAEMLIARAPDVIIEMHPPEGWTPERIARETELYRAYPSIPAVRNDRVYIFANPVLLVPGPRVVEGIRMLADTIHGSGPGVKP
jgi:iron complex transport system substrate-binding protein